MLFTQVCIIRILFQKLRAPFTDFTLSTWIERDLTLLLLFLSWSAFCPGGKPGRGETGRALQSGPPCPDRELCLLGETEGAGRVREAGAEEVGTLYKYQRMGRTTCTVAIKWDLNNNFSLYFKCLRSNNPSFARAIARRRYCRMRF